jgi:uncharacterized protein (DUF362 family)
VSEGMSLSRRDVLRTSLAGGLVVAGRGCHGAQPWTGTAYRKPQTSRVAIVPAADYGRRLADLVFDGLKLCTLEVRGRTVVLKPNLVEFDPTGVINTNPAVVAAAVDAFRRLGARHVIVAEGPGHRRDNEHLLVASHLHDVLAERRVPYVDLNYDDVTPVPLATSYTALGRLYLPDTIVNADLVVSMPKLKTHHWVGVTLSLKNMFGIVPGSVYGWPKNVLHWAGIQESILDVNAALSTPRFNIVDGIVGMEGNGPIHGTSIQSGVLLFGEDPVAVDATAARLMGIEPVRVRYLAEADRFLGNIREEAIAQIGASLASRRNDFRLIDSMRHLRSG